MKMLLSDKGTEYNNSVCKNIFDLLRITHKSSTPYHHETVGTVERSHRVLNEYLRSYINDNHSNWVEYIKYFTYCYNVTPHTSFECRFTPFELMFGRVPVSFDFLLEGRIDPIYNFDSYAAQIKFQLQKMTNSARELLELSKKKVKTAYDRNVRQLGFNVIDKVLLKKECRNKFEPLYTGPYIITEIDNVNATIVNLCNKKTQTVHKNRLVKIGRTEIRNK